MRSFTFRIFGIAVFSLEVADWVVDTAEAEEKPKEGMVGGSSHDFELDSSPYAPEDQFSDTYPDDRRVKLGFKA